MVIDIEGTASLAAFAGGLTPPSSLPERVVGKARGQRGRKMQQGAREVPLH